MSPREFNLWWFPAVILGNVLGAWLQRVHGVTNAMLWAQLPIVLYGLGLLTVSAWKRRAYRRDVERIRVLADRLRSEDPPEYGEIKSELQRLKERTRRQ